MTSIKSQNWKIIFPKKLNWWLEDKLEELVNDLEAKLEELEHKNYYKIIIYYIWSINKKFQ